MKKLFEKICVIAMGAVVAFSSAYPLNVQAGTTQKTFVLMDEDFSGFDENFEFIKQPVGNEKIDYVPLTVEGFSAEYGNLWTVESTNKSASDGVGGMLGSSAKVVVDSSTGNKYLSFMHNYTGTNGWPNKPRILRKIVDSQELTAYNLPIMGNSEYL